MRKGGLLGLVCLRDLEVKHDKVGRKGSFIVLQGPA
jgi:hypothetical protein